MVLLFFDASEPISKVDKQLCEYIGNQNTTAVFVANKWDLMKPRPTSEFVDDPQSSRLAAPRTKQFG